MTVHLPAFQVLVVGLLVGRKPASYHQKAAIPMMRRRLDRLSSMITKCIAKGIVSPCVLDDVLKVVALPCASRAGCGLPYWLATPRSQGHRLVCASCCFA